MPDVKAKEANTKKDATVKTAPVAAVVEKKTEAPAAKAAETKDSASKEIEKKPAKKPGRKPGRKPGTKKAVKTADKKKAADVRNTEVYVEYEGDQIATNEIVSKIEEAFKAEGHRVSTIKDLKVYINLEEKSAYYVINEKAEGKSVDL